MFQPIQPRQINYKMLLNQQMITSCTQRLLQIQRQIQLQGVRELQHKKRQQNIRLQQQLVSSVVMKQQAQKRLIEQQNLLIEYLKQQLYELTVSSNTFNLLIKNINQLQHAYLHLGQIKMQDEHNNQLKLTRAKQQYQQLIQLLPHVTNQSTVKYELVLKLRQRNGITSSLLKQKTILYQQLLRKYQQQHIKNSKQKQSNQQLQKTIQSDQQHNTYMRQSLQSQTKYLQINTNNRLQQLQQQIHQYQHSNNRLHHIHQSAQHDNSILKQQLQQKISQMKSKQHQLNQLNRQKQQLQKQKTINSDNFKSIIKQIDHYKDKNNNLLMNTQQMIYQLTQIGIQQQLVDKQIIKINVLIQKLRQIKDNHIFKINQSQQQIHKQSYFIQHYILINTQLIQQIEILIQQDHKKLQLINKGFINNKKISQSMIINKLRNLLTVARQQLKSIQLAHQNIVN